MLEIKNLSFAYKNRTIINDLNIKFYDGINYVVGKNGSGDSDIMMTDTINSFKSKFKGFHKTFKQDDLGLSLSSFLLN